MDTGILTTKGLEKIATAAGADSAVEITHVALGDGGGASYAPDRAATALRGERIRRPLDRQAQVEPTTWLTKATFPAADLPAFDCVEVGYFDQAGDLIALVVYGEVRKVGGYNYDLEMALDFGATDGNAVVVQAPDWGLLDLTAQNTADHAAFASQLLALEAWRNAMTDGAPGALDTIVELAQALNNDQDFAANVLAQLGALKTPAVTAIETEAALNAVAASSTLTVAKGVLPAPLAIGAIIEHTELSDGSARQQADRLSASGVFLTRHQRLRRAGVWGAWSPIGYAPGDYIYKSSQVIEEARAPADGAPLLRADHPDLFALWGENYGAGDGATTFLRPEFRGEFVRGWDNGRGVDDGRSLFAHQSDMVGPHLHDMNYKVNSVSGHGSGLLRGSDSDGSSPSFMGNPGGHETRPRNAAQFICFAL